MHPLIVSHIAHGRQRDILGRSERARLARIAKLTDEEATPRARIVLPGAGARRVSLEVEEPARAT